MLVVFGANGRTGVEIVREALARGMEVRPVCRDDRDVHRVDTVAELATVRYADPDHPASLAPVLKGATWVISAIDPRAQGPAAPGYRSYATENIARAARDAGARRFVHLSVMGAFRWHPDRLNRASFYLEGGVRAVEAPWVVLRVSSYHDEVIEGHVAPPDGQPPHPVPRSSRWSPLSRRDAAVAALEALHVVPPGRAPSIGGPEVFDTPSLQALLGPIPRRLRRTAYIPLPRGDLAVDPATTRSVLGYVPADTLGAALAEARRPRGAPASRAPGPVYPREEPPPHPADTGRPSPATASWGADLRRVVHRQLAEDLARLGLPTTGVRLDFSAARTREPAVEAHDGLMTPLEGVRVFDAEGRLIHEGAVDFLRDVLADEFRCWWAHDDRVPPEVLDGLDLGVRRRLAGDARFRGRLPKG